MITLCLDTSYKHLVIVLMQDQTIIDHYEAVCERNQSERIFPELLALLAKNHINQNDIKNIVITTGPGSYTGVRIAMTIAKVFGSLKKINVYTISTLQLYKAFDMSVIDAKGGKVFVGYENQDQLLTIEDAKQLAKNKVVSMDAQLLDQQPATFSIATQFLKTKANWQLVTDIDALVPVYLKEAI